MKKLTITLLLVVLAGCSHIQQQFDDMDITEDSVEVQLYKSLKASAIGYNAARETLRELDRVNSIPEERKAQIEKVAEKYRIAYHLALESWDLYEAGKATNVDWMAQANDALDIYSNFKGLIQ